MLTGREGFVDRIRARMAGCTAYLTKPFDFRGITGPRAKTFPGLLSLSKLHASIYNLGNFLAIISPVP